MLNGHGRVEAMGEGSQIRRARDVGSPLQAVGVRVTFPSGETRLLAPGPSSIITRAVIEVFANRFRTSPVVQWLSERGNKVVVRDDAIANAIGLAIEPGKNLPDLVMADLGPREPLILFVEVVATDGAMTERRRDAIHEITDAAGFDRKQVAFLTAYQDRQSAGFRKTVGQLVWGSFAWFVSEPTKLLVLHDNATEGRGHGSSKLNALMQSRMPGAT